MRFVYLGPPDEPDVMETIAFGLEWVKGQPMEVGDLDVVARLRRHPHWGLEGDDARDIGKAVVVEATKPVETAAIEEKEAEIAAWLASETDEQPPAKRRPGRPRKDAM